MLSVVLSSLLLSGSDELHSDELESTLLPAREDLSNLQKGQESAQTGSIHATPPQSRQEPHTEVTRKITEVWPFIRATNAARTKPRWTPSGLTMRKVRSEDIIDSCYVQTQLVWRPWPRHNSSNFLKFRPDSEKLVGRLVLPDCSSHSTAHPSG